MITLIPGAHSVPYRPQPLSTSECGGRQGRRSRRAQRALPFTPPGLAGTIPGAIGDFLAHVSALSSNLAVIFTLNQHMKRIDECLKLAPLALVEILELNSYASRPLLLVGKDIIADPADDSGEHQLTHVVLYEDAHPRSGFHGRTLRFEEHTAQADVIGFGLDKMINTGPLK